MKQTYFLTFLLFIFTAPLGFSQCTPYTYSGNHNTVFPSVQNFPHAKQNKAFNTTFYLQVAHDTTTGFGVYVFDYIHVDSVKIKPTPPGTIISYVCLPNDCSYLGGKTGCMNLTISPEMSQHPDSFQLIVYTTAKGTLGAVPNFKIGSKIDWYTIYVDSSNINSGIKSMNAINAKPLSVFPNPTQHHVQVEINNTQANPAILRITDITGKSIYKTQMTENKMELDALQIENGIYYLSVEYGQKTYTEKLIIQR